MSTFGDFGKFFTGPDLIPNIITLGGYGITKGTIQGALKVGVPAITSIVGGLAGQKRPNTLAQQMPTFAPHGLSPGPPVNISYGAPNYQAPYYGGGGGGSYDAYSLQPTYNPYLNPYSGGEQSWGYSTPLATYSPMPSATYSAPQDRTWEDLLGVGLRLLL